MDKWLMVVIGWGIVGPVLALAASYVLSRGAGKQSWRPDCSSGSRASSGLAPGSSTFCSYSFVRTPHPLRCRLWLAHPLTRSWTRFR